MVCACGAQEKKVAFNFHPSGPDKYCAAISYNLDGAKPGQNQEAEELDAAPPFRISDSDYVPKKKSE